MSTTAPRYLNRPSALRQRGPRADVCAWRFAKGLPRPLHHRDCTTASVRYGVSARPASRLAAPHPASLRILTYQSPYRRVATAAEHSAVSSIGLIRRLPAHTEAFTFLRAMAGIE
jgi:hypothetical protein